MASTPIVTLQAERHALMAARLRALQQLDHYRRLVRWDDSAASAVACMSARRQVHVLDTLIARLNDELAAVEGGAQ